MKIIAIGLLLVMVKTAQAQDFCAGTTNFIENPPKQWSYEGTECQAPAKQFCDCQRKEIQRQGQSGTQLQYEECLMISVTECRNSQIYFMMKDMDHAH